MYNYCSSSPTLTNVTFSGNSAASRRRDVQLLQQQSDVDERHLQRQLGATAAAAGCTTLSSSPTLTNVTFSGNSAWTSGGGMYNDAAAVRRFATRFSGAIRLPLAERRFTMPAVLPVVSDSVVQGGCPAGSTCTNIITADPMLGTLGNYGGFTQTIPLLPGSSAIDADQYQLPGNRPARRARPQGAACDIGAVEMEPPDVAIAKTVVPAIGVPGSVLTLTSAPPRHATRHRGTASLRGDQRSIVGGSDRVSRRDQQHGGQHAVLSPASQWRPRATSPAVSDLAAGAGGVITLTGIITASPASVLAGQIITNTAIITASNDITVSNNSNSAAPYRLCGPGTYLDTATKRSRAPGQVCARLWLHDQALLCEVGTYQPAAGQSSCLLAPVNTFVPFQGAVVADTLSGRHLQPDPRRQQRGACLSADVGIAKTVVPAALAPGVGHYLHPQFQQCWAGCGLRCGHQRLVPVSVTVSGVTSSTVGSGVLITQTSGSSSRQALGADFAWAVSDLAGGRGRHHHPDRHDQPERGLARHADHQHGDDHGQRRHYPGQQQQSCGRQRLDAAHAHTGAHAVGVGHVAPGRAGGRVRRVDAAAPVAAAAGGVIRES